MKQKWADAVHLEPAGYTEIARWITSAQEELSKKNQENSEAGPEAKRSRVSQERLHTEERRGQMDCPTVFSGYVRGRGRGQGRSWRPPRSAGGYRGGSSGGGRGYRGRRW